MNMRQVTTAVGTLVLTLAAWGCTNPTSEVRIHLDNLTDIPVGVYVNGVWAGTFNAGTSTDTPLGSHGGPPYSVEVRSPSDAVLLEVPVNEAQAESIGQAGRGVAGEVGLPCGIIRLVVGTLEADTVPAPARSVEPGPCA